MTLSGPIFGVIADDFTGAADIASMLARGGMRVIQAIGPFGAGVALEEADAVVIALKTRSVPAADAVDLSLAALHALQVAGIRQVQFKYCSTFDSTPQGNIGPVSDALAAAMGCAIVCHVPALPVNGRTVYEGHLFVGDTLLNESGMEAHPLNPMTDANLVRWLGHQTDRGVALVDHATLSRGAEAVSQRLAVLHSDGIGHVIGDAVDETDLATWSIVLQDVDFFAGGSGLATPLARAFAALEKYVAGSPMNTNGTGGEGNVLILAGSCSRATLSQIDVYRRAGGQIRQIDPVLLDDGTTQLESLTDWAADCLREGPVLIHASATPGDVERAQQILGRKRAGEVVEAALSELATKLAPLSQTGRVVVAGGETSGAVVSALGVAALSIEDEIDPGVPWTTALDGDGRAIVQLALKSGNFGAEDFFVRTGRLGAQ